MKRFFSALLAALMIVMTFAPVSVSAAGATVTVTASKATANVGEEIVFTVNIKNAPNIASMAVIFEYDKDAFTLTAGEFPMEAQMQFLLAGAQFFGEVDISKDNAAGLFAKLMTIENLDVVKFTLKAKKPVDTATVSCTVHLKEENDTTIPTTVTGTTVSVVCEHTFGDWTKHNAEQHKHTCTACGTVAYEAHKWDDGVVTKNPSHLAEGEKTFTCTVCGEKKTEKIAKTTDHSFGDWTKHNDTQHKKTCACGAVEYANHNWNAGEITKPASHVATGIKTYTCTDCGETKTETLPKTESHGFGKWEKPNDQQHKHACESGEIERHGGGRSTWYSRKTI